MLQCAEDPHIFRDCGFFWKSLQRAPMSHHFPVCSSFSQNGLLFCAPAQSRSKAGHPPAHEGTATAQQGPGDYLNKGAGLCGVANGSERGRRRRIDIPVVHAGQCQPTRKNGARYRHLSPKGRSKTKALSPAPHAEPLEGGAGRGGHGDQGWGRHGGEGPVVEPPLSQMRRSGLVDGALPAQCGLALAMA